jgi:hypothetical protein
VSRIFVTLACCTLLLLAASLVLGLSLGDIRQEITRDTLAWLTIHRLFGVATALAVVFVNSLVVIYFIGTSRWCREVVETYGLDVELIRRSVRLKRGAFPWAVMAMLTIVGVISLGAAADPATGRPDTASWTTPHLIGAIAGMAFIVWCFVAEGTRILDNQTLINEIVALGRRIRTERGLEV